MPRFLEASAHSQEQISPGFGAEMIKENPISVTIFERQAFGDPSTLHAGIYEVFAPETDSDDFPPVEQQQVFGQPLIPLGERIIHPNMPHVTIRASHTDATRLRNEHAKGK